MSLAKKICIVAPVHRYDDIRVFQKEAITLWKNGYEVTLLARKDFDETVNGIKVIAVPNWKHRIQRVFIQPWLLFKILKTKAKVIHFHNPDTLPIGFLLKLFKKKVVYDTHEDFSKRILGKRWIPRLLRRPLAILVSLLESVASVVFDLMIVTQKQQLLRLKKTLLIENAPILESEKINNSYELSKSIKRGEELRLIYVGGISTERGLFQMFEVLARLNMIRETRLWLIGTFAYQKDYEEAQKSEAWNYVDYLGFLPQEEAFSYVIKADLGLILILDVMDHADTSPNKIYEYNRLGIPFVASNFKKWKEDLIHVNSGIFVDPLDLKGVTKEILYLADKTEKRIKMGQNGYRFIKSIYNWENESKKLLNAYDQVFSSLSKNKRG